MEAFVGLVSVLCTRACWTTRWLDSRAAQQTQGQVNNTLVMLDCELLPCTASLDFSTFNCDLRGRFWCRNTQKIQVLWENPVTNGPSSAKSCQKKAMTERERGAELRSWQRGAPAGPAQRRTNP